MSGQRAFVAVEVADKCRARLEKLLPGLGREVKSRMTWTRPENWHLTLKFLGQLEPDRITAAKDALKGVPFEPFTIRPGGGGVFPGMKKPNVLWVGLNAGGPECAALARGINEALAPLGFPEGRPFLPHLTLGRVKLEKGDDWRKLLKELRKVEWPSFTVRRFCLFRSTLRSNGPLYTELAAYGPGARG